MTLRVLGRATEWKVLPFHEMRKVIEKISVIFGEHKELCLGHIYSILCLLKCK